MLFKRLNKLIKIYDFDDFIQKKYYLKPQHIYFISTLNFERKISSEI